MGWIVTNYQDRESDKIEAERKKADQKSLRETGYDLEGFDWYGYDAEGIDRHGNKQHRETEQEEDTDTEKTTATESTDEEPVEVEDELLEDEDGFVDDYIKDGFIKPIESILEKIKKYEDLLTYDRYIGLKKDMGKKEVKKLIATEENWQRYEKTAEQIRIKYPNCIDDTGRLSPYLDISLAHKLDTLIWVLNRNRHIYTELYKRNFEKVW